MDGEGKHFSGKNSDGTYNLGVCEPNADPLKCPIPPKRKYMERLLYTFMPNVMCNLIWHMLMTV